MWGSENWGHLVWGMAAPLVPLASPLGWMVLGGLIAGVGTRLLRTGRSTRAIAVTSTLLLIPLAAWAGNLALPHSFTNGDIADADEINANFNAVEAAVDDNDVRLDQLTALFGTNTELASSGVGGECTLGQVWLTAGYVSNGTRAIGQLVQISQNSALFSLLGTAYGGDGETTFGVPDLRDAAPSGLTYVICTQGLFPSPN